MSMLSTVKLPPEKAKRLLELSRAISATLDLDALLQSIVNAAADLTESEQASILQLDAADRSLRFSAARWMDAALMEELRVPLEGSIAGQAFRDLKPVIVEDAQADARLFTQVDQASGHTTHSLLAVPMLVHGRATGVLSAVNKVKGSNFDARDIFVMETLAAQAGIAIHNATLLNTSQQALEQKAELDKMKNNFISITSHELRIPLGLVLGHASYLKEITEGEALKQAKVIERAALRLKDIVEDLSRIETMQSGQSSLRLAPVDLGALLGSLLDGQQAQAEKAEVTIHTNFPAAPLVVEAEADKLATVFEHLIRNAITFSNPGGRIEVSLADEGEQVAARVADSGIGIPAVDLERVFERFYQVEAHMTRRHGGMGLGLAVARMLVELHHGRITVDSVEGQGSQFSLWLPKRQPTAS